MMHMFPFNQEVYRHIQMGVDLADLEDIAANRHVLATLLSLLPLLPVAREM